METYITPTIYQGLDCVQCAITNVLSYKKYLEVNTLWKSCQLTYDRSVGSIGNLSGTEFSLVEELKWIHNINLQKFNNESENSYLNNIQKNLSKKEPVLLILDTYFLEHHFGYNTFHSSHIVIATEIIGESILCVDDYQKFTGRIPFEQILKAASVENDELSFMTINISEAIKKLSSENYVEVINKNVSFLLGDEYPTTKISSGKIIGLNAVKEFIEMCKSKVKNTETIVLLAEMYNEIIKIANRHVSFTKIISERGDLYNDLEKSFEVFIDCSQEWKIIANMCLKGQYSKDERILSRIIQKMENNYNEELECILMLQRELEKR